MGFRTSIATFLIFCAALAQASPAAQSSPEVVLQNVTNISFHLAAASSDGRRLATVETGKLMLWDVASGLQIKSLSLLSASFNKNGGDGECTYSRITFLAGDKRIAIGGSCGSGNDLDQVVDIENNQTIHYVTSTQARGDYSPDGEWLVQFAENEKTSQSQLKLTRVSDGKLIKFQSGIEKSDEFAAHVIFLDMKTVAVCGDGGSSWRVHDLDSGKELFTLREADCSNHPAISQNRQLVIYKTWHRDRNPMLLNVSGGAASELLLQHNSDALKVTQTRFVGNAHQVEVRGIDAQSGHPFVATIDAPSLKILAFASADKAMPEPGSSEKSVSLRDGRWELRALWKGGLELWDADKAMLLRTLGIGLPDFTKMKWSADSKLLAILKESSGEKANQVLCHIQVWDMSTGRLKHSVHFEASDLVNEFEFSPDSGQLFWTINHGYIEKRNKGIRAFELNTGRFSTLFADKEIEGFQFSPDGKWLVEQHLTKLNGEPVSMPDDETIQSMTVYAYPSGLELAKLKATSLKFSKDSSHTLIFNRDDAISISVGDWKLGQPILPDKLSYLTEAYSTNPDQTLLAQDMGRFIGLNIYERGKKITRIFHSEGGGDLPYFSPDGDLMLMADANNVKTLYSAHIKGNKLQTIRALRSKDEPEGDSYNWSPDSNFLAEKRGETILLRNGKTGEAIANLFALDQSESVAVLPTGEYLATKGAMRAVDFRVGMTPYTFEQFDLKYNRPDIVLKALGKAPQRLIDAARRAYEKRLARAGFTEAMLATDFHLPEVSVKREGLPVSTSAPSVALNISAKDSQVPLDRLLVTVNDVPFDGRIAGIDLKAANSKQANKTVDIPILSGSNRIQVSVLNSQGVESYRETLEVRGDMPAVPGKIYALTIGVSQYQNAEYNLRYAAKDAKDIGALFSKAPRAAGTSIIPVLDTQATRSGILNAKKALLEAEPNDQVVVFLAGHGMLDDKLDYYFATTDIDFDHPASSGLSYDDIEGLLDGVKARRKLLLMDTCNSGELDKGDIETATLAQTDVPNSKIKVRAVGSRALKKKPDMLGQGNMSAFLSDLFADTRRGSGAVAISSAGGAEYALESDEWNNGVFTFALIDGLQTGAADKNKDGSVTASELRDLVQTRVQTQTQGKQTPTSRRENLTVDFAVY